MDLKTISTHIASARFNMGQLQAINMEPFRIRSHDLHLREFFKTPVFLTPRAVTVGCELQFVLHFWEIPGISGEVQQSCFGGPRSQLHF